MSKSFEKAKKDRDYLTKFLKRINYISEVYESSGSFVSFRVDNQEISRNLQSYLLKNYNIFIKQLTNVGLEGSNYFRVALVSKPQIDKLLKALESLSDKKITPLT